MQDFLCFVGHAHTHNELEIDRSSEMKTRKTNGKNEARRLTTSVLDKIEKEISEVGYTLRNVRLLVLYLSYRGNTEGRDREICETVLKTIKERFEADEATQQLRLIGHTTAGEIENEDIELTRRGKKVSGIGYNGLSLLGIVTNLPIGVAHSSVLKEAGEATKRGRKMVQDAWQDLVNTQEQSDQSTRTKTLLVLTQGGKASVEDLKGLKTGFEHFLASGIVEFMKNNAGTNINRVIGGSSGDGPIGRVFRQFYKGTGKRAEFCILEDEAVCALIPNVLETSVGRADPPIEEFDKDARLQDFVFDLDMEPKFMYIKGIDNESPPDRLAEIIFQNESRLAKERKIGLTFNNRDLINVMNTLEGFPTSPPVLFKYAFAFPYDDWWPICPIRTVHPQRYLELTRPVRIGGSRIQGRVVHIDCDKVQEGAYLVCEMLRHRSLHERDIVFLVSCVSRQLAEKLAEKKKDTEAQIFMERLLSTQVLGFLAYGEMSIDQTLKVPYHYNFSCWGLALRSFLSEKERSHIAKSTTSSSADRRFRWKETKGIRWPPAITDERESTETPSKISEEAQHEFSASPKEGLRFRRYTKKEKTFPHRKDEK